MFVIRLMLENNWVQSATVSRLLVDLKKMYELFKMKILFSIVMEFGVLLYVFGLIKMCLNVT